MVVFLECRAIWPSLYRALSFWKSEKDRDHILHRHVSVTLDLFDITSNMPASVHLRGCLRLENKVCHFSKNTATLVYRL